MGRSGPECRWWRGRRAHPAASKAQVRMEGCGGEWFGVPVPRLFLFVGALHPIRRQCTSSVRVQCPRSGAAPQIGCSAPRFWQLWWCRGCGRLLRVAYCLGFCVAACGGSSEISHAIPVQTLQTLKSYRWNCNILGRCRKFGYPNCMRLMVDEARQANSCVRTSAHDTVHDPRVASTCPAQLRCRGLRCHP